MRRARTNKRVARRPRTTKNSNVPRPKVGTLSRPPDNSGTVQIPRPLVVRSAVQKRTFKIPITFTSPTTGPINNYFSLYAPFQYTLNGSGFSSAPSSYNNMIASFGAYKPKRIQLIFEPLIPTMSTVIPVPYIVCMAPDVSNSTSVTAGTLEDYQNSTKISPSYPTEITYVIPSLSSGEIATEVLAGGWILSEASTILATSGGVIVYMPVTFITSATSYTQASLVFEVWFKNPL